MVLGSFPKKSLSWNICSLKSLPIWLGVALVIYTTYMIFNIRKQSSAPLIVAWTMYFRGTISAKVSPTMTNCPYQCDIVERSCDYGTRIPSAYIFHGRDVDVHDLPTRYPHQLMVFMLLEPPPYAGKAWKQFPYAYFNATMTYRNDSDYPLPYGKFVKRSATDETQTLLTERQIRKALQRKMRGALLLMSNCYSNSTRESIIRKLSEKIGITVAGRCKSMFPKAKQVHCPKSVNNGKCEDDLVATHRFYIAFENSLCRNYISEKFFRRVSQMMIPIVLNRRFYEENGIPPNSFIAVNDFQNDDELAKHMERVQHNDTEFLKYFEWTKHYRKPSCYVSDAACRLCADLHAERKHRVQDIHVVNRFAHQCHNNEFVIG